MDSENLLTQTVRFKQMQPAQREQRNSGGIIKQPVGLAAGLVLVSGFESPCLLGLGSLCLDLRLFDATCRREADCQNQELVQDGVWVRLTSSPRRRNALTRAQLLCSVLFVCR